MTNPTRMATVVDNVLVSSNTRQNTIEENRGCGDDGRLTARKSVCGEVRLVVNQIESLGLLKKMRQVTEIPGPLRLDRGIVSVRRWDDTIERLPKCDYRVWQRASRRFLARRAPRSTCGGRCFQGP